MSEPLYLPTLSTATPSLNMVKVPRRMHPATAAALAKSRPRRRGVEHDFTFYMKPEKIHELIKSSPGWPYGFKHPETTARYQLRDRALMACEYLGAFRITELLRGEVGWTERDEKTKEVIAEHRFDKLSILSNQFIESPTFLKLHGVLNLKHGAKRLEDYPVRVEIPYPRTGYLSVFTDMILDYLHELKRQHPRLYDRPGIELFGVKRSRGYQIIEYNVGFGGHFLRSQGLKLVAELVGNSLSDLQQFSGHRDLASLMKYLHTGNLEKNLLGYTPEHT